MAEIVAARHAASGEPLRSRSAAVVDHRELAPA
jgi:hypothetical protein